VLKLCLHFATCEYCIDAKGSECESNGGLAINEQNGILNAASINKLLGAGQVDQDLRQWFHSSRELGCWVEDIWMTSRKLAFIETS
jgi:hypothetical protein